MDFLNFKYAFYIAYIILGYLKSKSTGERKYLLFSLAGLLDITTSLLDYYLFTSNLELLLVNNLILLGLYFMLFHSLKKLETPIKYLLLVYTSIAVYGILLFILDLPKTDLNLYSDYGFLNTLESLCFCFIVGITCLIFSTISLIRLFRFDPVPVNLLLIIFGIITFYIGDILQSGMGIHFLFDSDVHDAFSNNFLTIRLFTSKGLIISGLLWKN